MPEDEGNEDKRTSAISIGTIIAVCISWSQNHSIFWTLVHGYLNWIYILYYVIFKL